MEMALALAMSVQRFEVRILGEVELLLTTVLKPRQGVKALVTEVR